MVRVQSLAPVALVALAFAGSPPVLAQDAAHPARSESAHACLDQKERRAEIDSGKLIRLSAAIHAARSRVPGGTIIQARLCRGRDGLVYVLTVLAHNGKVSRIAVDAVKGTFVGGL